MRVHSLYRTVILQENSARNIAKKAETIIRGVDLLPALKGEASSPQRW